MITPIRELFRTTDKAIIPTLPRYAYDGRIVVIQSETESEYITEILRKAPILGIDTETRPTFRRGESHPVALLQIASEEVCFLFRLNFMGFPPCLVNLLSDPNILKVGLSLKDDFMMLRHRVPSFVPAGYVDLQDYAAEMGIEDMSLQKLYANVFGRRISKSARLSNWEADSLSESQKVYAATDAVTCISLYKELKRLRSEHAYRIIAPTDRQAQD